MAWDEIRPFGLDTVVHALHAPLAAGFWRIGWRSQGLQPLTVPTVVTSAVVVHALGGAWMVVVQGDSSCPCVEGGYWHGYEGGACLQLEKHLWQHKSELHRMLLLKVMWHANSSAESWTGLC